MLNILKKNVNLAVFFVLFTLIISLSAFSYAQYVSGNISIDDNTQPFSDVPVNSYAYEPIHRLRRMGVTTGIGKNRFGYGRTMTRGEFITMLANLIGYDGETPQEGSFTDNMDPTKFYYGPTEAAFKTGIITNDSDSFRPDDPSPGRTQS